MPLINPIELLYTAQKNKTAVAAFNVYNLEAIQAVCEAAKEEDSPVILQTTPGSVLHMKLPFVYALAKTAAEYYNINLALHVDHCTSPSMILDCIDAGYTSVMIDSSSLPYEENIEAVKNIVSAARKKGVMVESELGCIAGTEDDKFVSKDDSIYTNPEQAADFVSRTGTDSLAVAIGTAHGNYHGKPELDFARLEEIKSRVSVPLVLHGASGVYDEDIKLAVSLGITKINIATELKDPMRDTLQKCFAENPKENDPRKYMGAVRDALKEVALHKIRLCKNN